MKILLDLNGWKKKVKLNDETATRVAQCGYIEIAITKPLDLLIKNSDITLDSESGAISVEFCHYGYYIDNIPIYKYVPKEGGE